MRGERERKREVEEERKIKMGRKRDRQTDIHNKFTLRTTHYSRTTAYPSL